MSEPTPVYQFKDVRTAAARHNINARLYLFDGGETIELVDMFGKQLARLTSMWGDEATVPDQAAKWLMEHTTVTLFDFVPEGE
jgi:hypothetical protein